MNRDNEIRELFAKHGITLMRDDVWIVQGQSVVRHKALERLGAAIRILWEVPDYIRREKDEAVIMVRGSIDGGPWEWSFGEARVQEMRPTGEKRSGKPVYEPQGIGNYAITPKQAAYPYAMAEKRGKDRVILKLAGLHGVYSEEEADNFKSPDDAEAAKPQQKQWKGEYVEGPPHKPDPIEGYHPPGGRPKQAMQELAQPGIAQAIQAFTPSKKVYIEKAIERMSEMENASQLLQWAKDERKLVWPQYGIEPHDEDGQRLVDAYKKRMAVLQRLEEDPE